MIDAALRDEVADMPEVSAFLDPSALSRRLREITAPQGVTPRLLGRSREGRPIEGVTIGTGARQILVYGLPHPNEPIGGLTALHLVERLLADRALGLAGQFTWHIVPCIDPDGLALNAGWLAGPFTLPHYGRHFYRPAGDEQVEWTFPLHHELAHFDAPLPETRLLMGLIDELRPVAMFSLHNSELGGVHYYLSGPQPGLYDVLQALPEHLGLPLQAGESEAPGMIAFAPGVYRWSGARDAYDHFVALGGDGADFPAGASAAEYADRHGTLTVVSELPYWKDPRAGDTTGSGVRYDEALRRQADDVDDVVAVLTDTLELLDPQRVQGSSLLRAAAYFARALAPLPAGARARAQAPGSDREATVAEVRSIRDLVHSFRLRFVGMLRRGIEDDPTLELPGAAALAARHEAWLAQAAAEVDAPPLPIHDLVAVQYGTIIATARHLAGRD